jgi:hypothetical protein
MRLALASCLLATTAFADTADDRFAASMHARIGSVSAPFYTTAHPIVRSELQAYSLIFDGWARVLPQWSVGARLAIATSSVEEPAGSYTADYTLGNPLLYVEYDRRWRDSTIGYARASVGLPLAGSGDTPSLVRNRVLAASDALEGWRSTELYQPGTVPLVLEATVDHVRPAWRARARAKLATLVRVTDASLPAEADPRPIGVVPSAELELGWRARPWLCVGLGAQAVALAIPPVDPIRDVGRSGRGHIGVVPQLEIVRGRAAFTVDLLVALAGPLDGSVGLGASIAWRQ